MSSISGCFRLVLGFYFYIDLSVAGIEFSFLHKSPSPLWHSHSECFLVSWPYLTHWGRVTHICVNKLIIIGSDNGLSPGRRQAIIWTNAEILLIGPEGTKFSEILNEIHIYHSRNAFENVVWKMVAILSRRQCVNCAKWWTSIGHGNKTLTKLWICQLDVCTRKWIRPGPSSI